MALAESEHILFVFPDGYMKNWNECRKKAPAAANVEKKMPMPVMIINGTNDKTNPYNGGISAKKQRIGSFYSRDFSLLGNSGY